MNQIEKQTNTSLRIGYRMIIPESVRTLQGIKMFWSPSFESKPAPPLSKREQLIREKQSKIWRAERERNKSSTGIVQMEQEAKLLAEGGRIPVVQRAEWSLLKKDRAIQVDKDGNLYEMRPVEHVKRAGSSEWELGDSQIRK